MKRENNAQMLLSIGSMLAAERERKGIPIEKAAKETRMRVQRLLDLENDDLSQFSSASYARMFIIAYAKYLGVPMEQVYEHLPERGSANAEAYHYIASAEHDLPSLRPDIVARNHRKSHLLPILGALAILILLGGAGTLGAYLWVNLPRLTESVKNIGNPPKAEPTPLPLKTAEEELTGSSTTISDTLEKSEVFEQSVSIVTAPATLDAPDLGAQTEDAEKAPAPSSEAALEDRAFLLETSQTHPDAEKPAPSPTP